MAKRVLLPEELDREPERLRDEYGRNPFGQSCLLARRLVEAGTPLQGVHLYGLARPSLQPEAERLERLPAGWLEAFAGRVRDLGLPAEVSP